MFTVKIRDTSYRVVFKHVQCVGTSCAILRGADRETETAYSSGRAYLSPHDNPDKRIGRKVSLTRALKPFDKETRKVFWTRYLEVCKH